MIIVYPSLAGVDVLNGSFSGTAPENCEGGTDTEISIYLYSSLKFLFIPSRFINSRVPIPLCWCCSYHSGCIVAAGIRDIPTL